MLDVWIGSFPCVSAFCLDESTKMGTCLVLIDHPTVATTQLKSSLQQALTYLLLTCETQRSTLPSSTGNPPRSDREPTGYIQTTNRGGDGGRLLLTASA
jgi:hypothetical protein